MKKLLLVGIALIALSSILFWQCEKSETTGLSDELFTKQLNGRNWYPQQMQINGEIIKFKPVAVLVFDKKKLSMTINQSINCVADISYLSSTQFSMDTQFDCLQNPSNSIKPNMLRLLEAMNGAFETSLNANKLVLSAEGVLITFTDGTFHPESLPAEVE